MKFRCSECGNVIDKYNIKCLRCGNNITYLDLIKAAVEGNVDNITKKEVKKTWHKQ